jgi:hypothetical protein
LAALALLACSDEPAGVRDPVREAASDGGTQDAEADAGRLDASPGPSADAAGPVDAGAPDARPDPSDPIDATVADAEIDAAVLERPRTRLSLVSPLAWQDVAEADDPWDDAPDDATCAAEGHGYELFQDQEAYFVDTARCGYVTVAQGSSAEVRAGEEVVVRAWYFDLYGPTGAEAHLTLRIGERDVIDEHIAIPASPMLVREHFVAEQAIPAGTPISLHVHNHGANQYYLLEVSTGPAGG